MKTSIHILFLFIFSFLAIGHTIAQETSFTTGAPNAVIQGQQFRLTYTLSNAEGSGMKLNGDIRDLKVIYGPSVANSSNIQIINGQRSSSSTQSYTYILLAENEGTFTLPGATIQVRGKTYSSKPVQIKVLPGDKKSNQGQSNSSGQGGSRPTTSKSTDQDISSSDAFIRAIVTKTKVYEQEAFQITFRLYTAIDVVDLGLIEFPEFNGFMVENQDLKNMKLELEHYNNRNYYAVDLKRSVLFPQKSGEITIPSGKIDVVFNVPSGKAVNTFWGPQYVMTNVTKTLVTNPVKINVMSFPERGKPESFVNAVGSFTMSSSISSTKIIANDAITITLDISGTGNLKLIKTPDLILPTDFEEYDPEIKNNFKLTPNGLTGNKKIEYLFIPRHPGTFTIPAMQFSYFDVKSKSYKTLTTPEYKLDVQKDPNAVLGATTNYTKSDVKVNKDILYIKTGKLSTTRVGYFFAGSLLFYLLYIVPALLFIILLYLYRKQLKESADIVGMRTKRANKVATKRLKQAAHYLSANKKEAFYEEVLRAMWGYLSDKLTIPVSELSRDNIEQELVRYGASSELISKIIYILDTCEYAQYAPGDSDTAMDNLYNDTVKAIGGMENTKNRRS